MSKIQNMHLLKSQRNELYDLIEKSNLLNTNFTISDPHQIDKRTVIRYTDKNEHLNDSQEYIFVIAKSQTARENIYYYFTPGHDAYSTEDTTNDFRVIVFQFNRWLNSLRIEISTEDKWQKITDFIPYLQVNSNTYFDENESNFNKLITQSDVLKLKGDMLKLTDKMNQINELKPHLIYIQSQLDNLTDLALGMKKFDWQNLFVGTVISILIQLSVTQENARYVFEFIKNIFASNYLDN